MAGLFKRSAAVALALAAAGAVGAGLRLSQWAHTATPIKEPQTVTVTLGMPLGALAATLKSQGLVTSAPFFQAWVRVSHDYTRFQAGSYRFEGQVSPAEVVVKMTSGETYHPVVLQVVIPEGWTLKHVVERLAASGIATASSLDQLAHDRDYLRTLKIPSTSLEGYLYPATYSFYAEPTPQEAFETMVKTFWQNLPPDYESRVQSQGLSLGQAVTFASLIEAETRHDDEKPLISEVIWRRLKDKAPLAIDAALIYGIPDYAGDIKWAHLSDAKNRYNTRIHIGLPPTPIGAPGVKALAAVLTPSNQGFYYYVLLPGQDRHQFSRTLKEHNEYVKKLVRQSKPH